MIIDNLQLGYFEKDHSSTCSYCNVAKSYSLGFVATQLTPSTYEQMMDRGWRRCGTYYYKYNFQLNCCLAYTIRSNVLLSQQKKGQRKIAKHFLKVLNSDLLKQKVDDFPKFLVQCEDDIKKVKSNQQKIKQETQQQKKQIPQQQKIIQKEDLKKQIAVIPKETIDELQSIFQEFLSIIKSQKQEFTSLFQQYFDGKGFHLNEVQAIIQFDVNFNGVKIFKSQQESKGDYFTNFIMLLYGLNKKLLFLDFSVESFGKCLIPFVLKYFKNGKYSFVQETNGFLSIFHSENEARLAKHLTQVEKQVKKAEQQIQQEPILQTKNNIQLIDRATFKTNVFYVGQMKVKLKPAECTDENFQLYQRYCKTIHGKVKEKKEDYESFLCEQGLKKNLIKSNVDNGQLLFMGCYHMCYYIQDNLVAVGVVDITENVMSSVYFFYDPAFESLNFGTFGALVEIEYIKLVNQYFDNFKYYYLGFYLQNTNKMAYKGDFEPCELLCPETYNWVELTKELRQEIDKRQVQAPNQRIVKISNANLQEDMRTNDKSFYDTIKVLLRGQVYELKKLNFDMKKISIYLDQAYERLGRRLMQTIIFQL